MWQFLGLSFFALMLSSQAAANHLEIDPSEPLAGAEVQAIIYLGGSSTSTFCRSRDVNLDGDSHDINVDGNTIQLDVVMNPQAGICVTVLPPTPHSFNLGTLAAGSYNLVVSEVGPDTTFPVTDQQRTELASMVFGVTPGPFAIPVNQPLALAILIGLLLFAGIVLSRTRNRIV